VFSRESLAKHSLERESSPGKPPSHLKEEVVVEGITKKPRLSWTAKLEFNMSDALFHIETA
jgi:hypothetical protein